MNLPLLPKSFPAVGLTDFSKVNGFNKEETGLTGFGKKASIANFSSNKVNDAKISHSNTQKLYKRMGNNQLKRVRSVVRISRRSSEPQTVGSKPSGPVIHTCSNIFFACNGY
jgi:hypothetical protein